MSRPTRAASPTTSATTATGFSESANARRSSNHAAFRNGCSSSLRTTITGLPSGRMTAARYRFSETANPVK